MTHMPKRYWGMMTEFQDESYFKARPKETPQLLQRPALQPRYLHLRHAQKARRLLLRQPLEKAQQDRHFLASGIVDGFAQRDALNERPLDDSPPSIPSSVRPSPVSRCKLSGAATASSHCAISSH